MKKIVTALTIAGSDTSGGAGIQADLKVFEEFEVYGMSVITALTAQNTLSVSSIMPVKKTFFRLQLETLLSDIKPDALKTGMIYSSFMAEEIKYAFDRYRLKNLVCDPVMLSKSGSSLSPKACAKKVIEKIFPLCEIVTPNIPEAEFICKMKIRTEKDIISACHLILDTGARSVLIKGGHGRGDIVKDYYCENGKFKIFERKRIKTKNTHGTGCSLSAAITSLLAYGKNKIEAVSMAIDYIDGAIKNSFSLGAGCGPLNHFYRRTNEPKV